MKLLVRAFRNRLPLVICVAVSTVLALLVPTSVVRAADKKDAEPSSWAATLAFEEGYTDNVQWTGDSQNQDDAFFETIEGNFAWENLPWHYAPDHAAAGVRGRIFNGFSERDYAEVNTEMGYDVGRTTTLSIGYDYISNQIQVDQDANGNTVYSVSHALTLAAEHKFGETKRLRAGAEFEADWDDSQGSSNARDSFTPTGGVFVRYLLHDLFRPKAGLSYGVRDARSPNYSRDEFEVETGFESRLTNALNLGVRYRWIMRDYTVGSPTSPTGTNSNYRREDHANHFEARLEYAIPYVDGMSVTARFRMRDNASNHDSHDFNVHEGGLGVSYTFR